MVFPIFIKHDWSRLQLASNSLALLQGKHICKTNSSLRLVCEMRILQLLWNIPSGFEQTPNCSRETAKLVSLIQLLPCLLSWLFETIGMITPRSEEMSACIDLLIDDSQTDLNSVSGNLSKQD